MRELTYKFYDYPALELDNGQCVGFLEGEAGIEFDNDGNFGVRWIVLSGLDNAEIVLKADEESSLYARVLGYLNKDKSVKAEVENELDSLGIISRPDFEPLGAQSLGVGAYGSYARVA